MTSGPASEVDHQNRSGSVVFHTVDPESEPALRAVARYFDELARRFSGGFRADAVTADAATLRAPGGAFVIARRDGAVVGCGGVRTLADGIGEIKRMWIDPDCRGVGLGSALLRHLETVSAGLGHRVIRLDTNDNLTEALALYRRRGYREIPCYNENQYAKHWFEKTL